LLKISDISELAALPTQKSHLLLIPMLKNSVTYLQNNALYIKPETYGLSTWGGFFDHLKDYASMKYSNIFPRLKDYPQELEVNISQLVF
jgi:hypothetical protein